MLLSGAPEVPLAPFIDSTTLSRILRAIHRLTRCLRLPRRPRHLLLYRRRAAYDDVATTRLEARAVWVPIGAGFFCAYPAIQRWPRSRQTAYQAVSRSPQPQGQRGSPRRVVAGVPPLCQRGSHAAPERLAPARLISRLAHRVMVATPRPRRALASALRSKGGPREHWARGRKDNTPS